VNDTVAVALITSLSTLTAAGPASWVTTRTTGRQLRHQAALAREERAERRAADRGQLRREAYERFLTRADAAYLLLDEAFVRVSLVGPEPVGEKAAAVVRAMTDEFRTHATPAPASPTPTHTAPSPRAQALRTRSTTTTDFLTAARRALENE
jgi:hypothetical protein